MCEFHNCWFVHFCVLCRCYFACGRAMDCPTCVEVHSFRSHCCCVVSGFCFIHTSRANAQHTHIAYSQTTANIIVVNRQTEEKMPEILSSARMLIAPVTSTVRLMLCVLSLTSAKRHKKAHTHMCIHTYTHTHTTLAGCDNQGAAGSAKWSACCHHALCG